jgi:CheY-like chemotaxis protein
MFVDKEGTVYGSLAGPLARAGIELSRAESPAEAVLLAQKRPQAVVINFTMPERVGDEAFLRLRSDAAGRSIPVVFLINPRRWGRRAHDAAADALVPCPWAPRRVLSAIQRVVTGGPGLAPRGVRPQNREDLARARRA